MVVWDSNSGFLVSVVKYNGAVHKISVYVLLYSSSFSLKYIKPDKIFKTGEKSWSHIQPGTYIFLSVLTRLVSDKGTIAILQSIFY